jgi:hypothetical protein
MSDTELHAELKHSAYEPLLPIEKKLIGWSLGLGLVLLAALLLVNHFFPLNV